jgi:hypothetical protein
VHAIQLQTVHRHWFCKVAFPHSCQIEEGGSENPGSNWRFNAESSAALMDIDMVCGSFTRCIWTVMGKIHTRQLRLTTQLRLHGVKPCRRNFIYADNASSLPRKRDLLGTILSFCPIVTRHPTIVLSVPPCLPCADAGATRPQQRFKIMVALEMPREFVSHPVMKQVSEGLVKTIS